MRLVQSRLVTGNVERLAAFYARLFGAPVALPAGNLVSVFSR